MSSCGFSLHIIDNLRVIFVAVLISLGGSFHYGIQVSCMNPSEAAFRRFINASYTQHTGRELTDHVYGYLWPMIVNLQLIGALIGTFFIRVLSERVGRKNSFYVISAQIASGAILMALSKLVNSWELLAVGRLASGVAHGQAFGLQPLYLNEISPKEIRGLIGSITGVMVELGFLFGTILALPRVLGDDRNWPYEFVVELCFSLILLSSLPFLAESPKFLASRGDEEGALRALKSFRSQKFFKKNSQDEQVEILKMMLEEIRQELKASNTADPEKSAASFVSIFTTGYIRKGLLLGWVVLFSSGYSGIMALSFFSTSVFRNGGLSDAVAEYATAGLSAVCFVAAVFGGMISDRFGRRSIVLCSTGLMLLLNVLFIVFANLNRVHGQIWAGYANIVVAFALAFVFGVGPAVIMWCLTAEMMPQHARSTAHTLAMIFQWLCETSSALIIYPLQLAVNEYSFLLHVVSLSAALVYCWFALPETKNKSQLDIMRALGYKEETAETDGAQENYLEMKLKENMVTNY